MIKTITNLEMLALHAMHKELATVALPFKFTIAKNLKTLNNAFTKYTEEQQELHSTYVLVDGEGNATLKLSCLELAKDLQNVPYQFFQYKDEESEKEFYSKLNALNTTKFKIELFQESLERKVRVKVSEKDKEDEHLVVTLQEYLDEFTDVINANTILDLLKHEILV